MFDIETQPTTQADEKSEQIKFSFDFKIEDNEKIHRIFFCVRSFSRVVCYHCGHLLYSTFYCHHDILHCISPHK